MLACEVLAGGAGLALTPDDQRLVRFLTASDRDEAKRAWSDWKRHHPLDRATFREMLVMPAAGARLVDLGLDDADLGRMQGLARYFWLWTQRTTRASVAAARALEQRSRVVALKGLALHASGWVSARERPMVDGDLLVSRGPDQAGHVLGPLGFGIRRRHPHAWSFTRGPQEEIDLHRFPLHRDRRSSAWAFSGARAPSGSPFTVPAPAQLVLHACLHGVQRPSSVLWALDVFRINARADVDWSAIVERARQRRYTLPLLDALSVLSAAVPERVIGALGETTVSVLEVLEYADVVVRASGPWTQPARAGARIMHALRCAHDRVDDERVAAAERRATLPWERDWVARWQQHDTRG